ncbi:MAG: tetratricopeptide repeat protein [Elusimicrobia bacterium]|nr:tetratricopeptide repeat protein [Elusimicrobiota bacterium]
MAKLGRLGDAASRFRALLQQARHNFGEADFRALESARALAECLWELGEYVESESIPERLLALPPTAQTRLTAGRILRYQENNERAAEVLAQGASAFPDDSDFSYELGLVQDRSGHFEDAVRSLSHARALSPGKKHLWSALARSLFHAGRFADLLALGPDAAACGASSPELDMQLGFGLISCGKIPEGRALVASASDAGAYDYGYRTFASQHRDAGRSSEAEPLHQKSWRESMSTADTPKSDFEAARLTCVFMGQKKWSEGENVARVALEDMKNRGRYDYAWACQISQFADILISTGRHDEAEDLYRTMLETGEKIGTARSVRSKLLWGLARVNRIRGRREKALDFVRRSRGLRDRPFGDDHMCEAQSLQENAGTLMALDAPDEAAELYAQLSAMSRWRPYNTRIILGLAFLGHLRLRQGRNAEAERLFSQVLDLREKIRYQIPVYTALSGMTQIYVESGRLPEAEKLLLAFKNDPSISNLASLAQTQQNPNPSGMVEILRLLAVIAAQKGEMPGAIAYELQALREARAQRDSQKYDELFSELQKAAEAAFKRNRT